MYEWLGICLALSALLTLNAAISALTAMVWRLVQARANHWSAKTKAQWIFVLRVFPGIASLISVAVFLIPAYIAHEPRHQSEHVTIKLAALAAFSAAGVVLAGWRGLAAWRVTRNLIRQWLANSESISLNPATIQVPAYRLRHAFPVIAVVGTFRPKLFIADFLFDSLTPKELAAAIAHECGHLAARDNLKRTLLRICRDVLTIVPCGRALDRYWAEASEEAADEFAAQHSGRTALELASALVKIARLVPQGGSPILSAKTAGALLIGQDLTGLARRVTRLTELASATKTHHSMELDAPTAVPASLWLLAGTVLMAIAMLANSFLATVHKWIEFTVSILQ